MPGQAGSLSQHDRWANGMAEPASTSQRTSPAPYTTLSTAWIIQYYIILTCRYSTSHCTYTVRFSESGYCLDCMARPTKLDNGILHRRCSEAVLETLKSFLSQGTKQISNTTKFLLFIHKLGTKQISNTTKFLLFIHKFQKQPPSTSGAIFKLCMVKTQRCCYTLRK